MTRSSWLGKMVLGCQGGLAGTAEKHDRYFDPRETAEDLDKEKREGGSIVGLVTRVPRGELIVHLDQQWTISSHLDFVTNWVIFVQKRKRAHKHKVELFGWTLNNEYMLLFVKLTFSVSSSSRSSGERDSRKVQSGCFGAILGLFL